MRIASKPRENKKLLIIKFKMCHDGLKKHNMKNRWKVIATAKVQRWAACPVTKCAC